MRFFVAENHQNFYHKRRIYFVQILFLQVEEVVELLNLVKSSFEFLIFASSEGAFGFEEEKVLWYIVWNSSDFRYLFDLLMNILLCLNSLSE